MHKKTDRKTGFYGLGAVSRRTQKNVHLSEEESETEIGDFNISLTIHSAQGLKNKEGKIGGSVSDPYCEIVGHGTTTSTCENNLNPEWEETTTLNLKNPNEPINIRIYDQNTLKGDKLMGFTTLQTMEFVKDEEILNLTLPVISTNPRRETDGSLIVSVRPGFSGDLRRMGEQLEEERKSRRKTHGTIEKMKMLHEQEKLESMDALKEKLEKEKLVLSEGHAKNMDSAIADRDAAQKELKAELEKLRAEKEEVKKMQLHLEDDLRRSALRHAEEIGTLQQQLATLDVVNVQLQKERQGHKQTHDTIEKMKKMHEHDKREAAEGHMLMTAAARADHRAAQKELEDTLARMAEEKDSMDALKDKLENEKLILREGHAQNMNSAIADRDAALKKLEAELEELRAEKEDINEVKQQLENDLRTYTKDSTEYYANLEGELVILRAMKEQLEKENEINPHPELKALVRKILTKSTMDKLKAHHETQLRLEREARECLERENLKLAHHNSKLMLRGWSVGSWDSITPRENDMTPTCARSDDVDIDIGKMMLLKFNSFFQDESDSE